MIEQMIRMSPRILATSSGGAATEWYHEVPSGEGHIIYEVVGYHDDPAGATLSWALSEPGGGTGVTIPIGAVAVNVRSRLGAYFALPVFLPPLWVVYLRPSAALAAGKKLYLEVFTYRMRGVPGGVWT